jgi:hypothetical protein
LGATAESGEPGYLGPGGVYYYARSSVWWKWTAPGNGTATVWTTQDGFRTFVGVYEGLAPSLQSRVDNSHLRIPAERVIFRAREGATYLISVDGEDLYGGDFPDRVDRVGCDGDRLQPSSHAGWMGMVDD